VKGAHLWKNKANGTFRDQQGILALHHHTRKNIPIPHISPVGQKLPV
jgi:hypothetical protein